MHLPTTNNMKKMISYVVLIMLCHSLTSAAPTCLSNNGLQLQISSQLQDDGSKDLMDGSEDKPAAYPMDIYSLRF